ncbi:sulfatase-like hydrolase/transferase [Cupriavidus basilensis]
MPTAHGFDEFFGNLYHLNAEEEPERPYYPKNDTAWVKANGPRGVLHSFADGKVEDTGPLNRKRMGDHRRRNHGGGDRLHGEAGQGRQAVLRVDEHHAHARVHARARVDARTERDAGQLSTRTACLEHDGDVGKLLKSLDDLKVADNTIVVYSTDNGPNQWSWPDAATTPFRSEKDTNWEGAFRVPALVRWPGRIKLRHGVHDHDVGSTGSRRCWRRPAMVTSRTVCSRAPALAESPSRCTWMAITSCHT